MQASAGLNGNMASTKKDRPSGFYAEAAGREGQLSAEAGALLQVRGLCKHYQCGARRVAAVDQLDLELHSGELVVVMGSSGSGKSTLLYLLGGLLRASAGEIQLEGQRIDSRSEAELALLRRSAMGFVFQSANLVPHLSLLENVTIPGLLAGARRAEVEQRARALLSSFDLAPLADRLPAQLSGGEQQRGAVARALVNTPRVLFADEPTGALNSAAGRLVLDLFSELNARGQTILMVTHDVVAAACASRVLFMRDGAVIGEQRFDRSTTQARAARERALSDWLLRLEW